MPERGPVQFLLPSLSRRALRRCAIGLGGSIAVALVAVATPAGHAVLDLTGLRLGDHVRRLGSSAVARDMSARPEASASAAEPVYRAADEERRAVAIGDSITVTSPGGEMRRFRITGLKLLDGGCPSPDPHLSNATPSELCWAADATGKLRFVIQVESEAEPESSRSAQQKL